MLLRIKVYDGLFLNTVNIMTIFPKSSDNENEKDYQAKMPTPPRRQRITLSDVQLKKKNGRTHNWVAE